MRIVHFAESWGGGIETYLKSLIAAEIDDPRFCEIVLLTPETGEKPFAGRADLWTGKLSHRTYPFKRSPLGLIKGLFAARRALIELNPDLLYLHCTFPGLMGRLAKLTSSLSMPIAYIPHGWAFQQDRGAVINRLFGLVERLLAPLSELTIHISHAEYFAARRMGVKAKRDVIIQNGVRDVETPPQTASGPDDGPLRLGFVGRFDRQKGVHVLLEAFTATPRTDMILELIGWSYLGDAKLHAVDTDDRITVIGRVAPDKIDAAFRSFDCLIVPSRFEGFGLVVAEAMRNGCPVIVSDRQALPFLVIPGFNGEIFTYPHPDTLTEILMRLDRPTLKRWGMNARRVFENTYNDAHMVEVTHSELLKLLKSPN